MQLMYSKTSIFLLLWALFPLPQASPAEQENERHTNPLVFLLGTVTKQINTRIAIVANKTFVFLKEKRVLLHPGTNWCGVGHKSGSYEDLGYFAESDRCCREHDFCSKKIRPGETSSVFNLTNTGLIVRSDCSCDARFYNCLKKVDSSVSKEMGFLYFMVFVKQCFREDYPVVGCLLRKHGRCVVYLYDRKKEKIYQWFDNPVFRN
ncbi:unnamed protein product [Tenebrio molitor]|nr:unnamed protein product [Tenebrio molitor]